MSIAVRFIFGLSSGPNHRVQGANLRRLNRVHPNFNPHKEKSAKTMGDLFARIEQDSQDELLEFVLRHRCQPIAWDLLEWSLSGTVGCTVSFRDGRAYVSQTPGEIVQEWMCVAGRCTRASLKVQFLHSHECFPKAPRDDH